MTDSERIAQLEAWLLELASFAGLNDPNDAGKMLCWCAPRGPFARGPHHDSCLATRAYFAAPRTADLNSPEPK